MPDRGGAEVELDEVGGMPVTRVHGEVDLSNADAVGGRLTEVLSASGSGLLVDLSAISFLDSSGLRMLLNLGRTANDLRRRLHLVVGEGSFVAELMEVTQVGRILELHGSVDEALNSL